MLLGTTPGRKQDGQWRYLTAVWLQQRLQPIPRERSRAGLALRDGPRLMEESGPLYDHLRRQLPREELRCEPSAAVTPAARGTSS